MSNEKLRIRNTKTDNLISNLRGEVGEILFTWVLMRSFMAQAAGLRTGDMQKDMGNRQLIVLDALRDKLSDEIVARLAELAEPKVGQLTFHFANLKLGHLEKEASEFARFIKRNRFQEKRNHDISHKQLPEKWVDHKRIYIRYRTILRGIVAALRLMKRIDAVHLGPRAKYLWREMRRRRYKMVYPASVEFLLLPHIWLPAADRMKIVQEEMADGRDVWKDMLIRINGKETAVKTYGELGAVDLGGQFMLLDDAFIELTSIDFMHPSEMDKTKPSGDGR